MSVLKHVKAYHINKQLSLLLLGMQEGPITDLSVITELQWKRCSHKAMTFVFPNSFKYKLHVKCQNQMTNT